MSIASSAWSAGLCAFIGSDEVVDVDLLVELHADVMSGGFDQFAAFDPALDADDLAVAVFEDDEAFGADVKVCAVDETDAAGAEVPRTDDVLHPFAFGWLDRDGDLRELAVREPRMLSLIDEIRDLLIQLSR